MLALATVVIACLWITVELVSLRAFLDPGRDADVPIDDTAALIGRWFADRPKTVEDRRRLYGELPYEGDRSQAKITRFAMLMIFSSIIASMGVVSDSTAVVVGAGTPAPDADNR